MRGLAPAAKGLVVALDLLQPRHHPPHGFRGEAGAHAADIDQLLAAMDAGQQRAQPSALAGPAADHHLVAAAALGLGPVPAASGLVRRIEALGDDAFEMHPAGRLQHRIAGRLEVIDVAEVRGSFDLANRAFSRALRSRSGSSRRSSPLDEQQVEGKVDQLVGLVVGQGRLKRGEIRRAVLVQRHDLAVEQAIGQRARGLGDAAELGGPVEPLARAKLCVAVFDAELHAIAVELDLVRPARLRRGALDQLAELRLDETRHGRRRRGLGGFITLLDPRRHRPRGLARDEGRRRLALAGRDRVQAAAGGDGFGVRQEGIAVALAGGVVAVLDQQPVGALAAPAVVLHAHEHPAALQPLAFQSEFQVAALQPLMRIALGNPVAAVPQLHRAAAILALGNGAFEIAIVERVVLDLDRKALVVRIERGPARHRPGLEDAVELEPEIVVQAPRVVPLDDEAQRRGGRHAPSSPPVRCLGEIPLGAIFAMRDFAVPALAICSPLYLGH